MLVSAKLEGIRDRHLKKILEEETKMKEGNKDKKLPNVISERRVKMAAKYGFVFL